LVVQSTDNPLKIHIMIKSAITFSHVDFKSDTLKSRENQDTLLQWNLLECLSVERYLFSGPFHDDASPEYDRLLNDFFYCSDCHVGAPLSSSSQLANSIDSELLSTSVMTMEFFDRLLVSDILASSGYIRGCFDEIYDGITVSDKLRDFLINEQSDSAAMYDVEDRKQFIFAIFKLFAVGGSMCQPDSKIQRSCPPLIKLFELNMSLSYYTIFRSYVMLQRINK
jgi:Domain of unknown function (DUF4498)